MSALEAGAPLSRLRAQAYTIPTDKPEEEALKISGPLSYPWGPKRPRYPYRAHELNAAALVLARGAQALGIDWTPKPLATVSAPRGESHQCVYRGFCVTGCSTNAKQSALVTWIPWAVHAGAEIRDLAMVGRIETGDAGEVTGVHYLREGVWQYQRARNVVVNGTARMGDDPRTSVVDADCRSWDIPNLWICDGSVFPTVGGVNPSLTIQAIACRTADRIEALAARGELSCARR